MSNLKISRKTFYLLLFVLSFSSSSLVYAGPFGLEMGMTLDQIEIQTGIKPIISSSGKVYTITPPKPHSTFNTYVIRVSPTLGLHFIKAISTNISTSVYGTELLHSFNSIKESIGKTYGKYYQKNALKTGSIWNEEKDWMMGLKLKERDLYAYWSPDDGSSLPKDITYIQLEAKANSTNIGYLVLDYYFANDDEATKEIEAVTDSVF